MDDHESDEGESDDLDAVLSRVRDRAVPEPEERERL